MQVYQGDGLPNSRQYAMVGSPNNSYSTGFADQHLGKHSSYMTLVQPHPVAGPASHGAITTTHTSWECSED